MFVRSSILIMMDEFDSLGNLLVGFDEKMSISLSLEPDGLA